ncbi:MAG: hypothetical protein ACE5J2_08210 [Nitrososphaerales archaeon]
MRASVKVMVPVEVVATVSLKVETSASVNVSVKVPVTVVVSVKSSMMVVTVSLEVTVPVGVAVTVVVAVFSKVLKTVVTGIVLVTVVKLVEVIVLVMMAAETVGVILPINRTDMIKNAAIYVLLTKISTSTQRFIDSSNGLKNLSVTRYTKSTFVYKYNVNQFRSLYDHLSFPPLPVKKIHS